MAARELAKELRRMREEYVPSAYVQHHPIHAISAEGPWIWDAEGDRYLDFAGGIGSLNVGHRHPRVVQAVSEQVNRLFHTGPVMLHEGYIRLASRLAGRIPGEGPRQVLFVNSGAEAVENAVKIARHATGRPAVIAFDGAFHGRTLLTSTLTGRTYPFKTQPGALAPDVYHAPYPYPYRPPRGVEPDALVGYCMERLDKLTVTTIPGSRIAAVIVEPVQGEGGYVVPPAGFLVELQKWCRSQECLLIVDEIQTGIGRTGRFLALEHEGIDPDIVVLGKSIAGGLPLAAVVARANIFQRVEKGDIGGTYGGNPLACAAGLAILDVFEEEDLLGRSVQIGQQIEGILLDAQEHNSCIGEVRGLGAMWAIELVSDQATKEPAQDLAAKVIVSAREQGLILIKAGLFDNVIRVLAPIAIEDAELEKGMDILVSALSAG